MFKFFKQYTAKFLSEPAKPPRNTSDESKTEIIAKDDFENLQKQSDRFEKLVQLIVDLQDSNETATTTILVTDLEQQHGKKVQRLLGLSGEDEQKLKPKSSKLLTLVHSNEFRNMFVELKEDLNGYRDECEQLLSLSTQLAREKDMLNSSAGSKILPITPPMASKRISDSPSKENFEYDKENLRTSGNFESNLISNDDNLSPHLQTSNAVKRKISSHQQIDQRVKKSRLDVSSHPLGKDHSTAKTTASPAILNNSGKKNAQHAEIFRPKKN